MVARVVADAEEVAYEGSIDDRAVELLESRASWEKRAREEQAREEQAREEQAREEQAREEQARAERAREESVVAPVAVPVPAAGGRGGVARPGRAEEEAGAGGAWGAGIRAGAMSILARLKKANEAMKRDSPLDDEDDFGGPVGTAGVAPKGVGSTYGAAAARTDLAGKSDVGAEAELGSEAEVGREDEAAMEPLVTAEQGSEADEAAPEAGARESDEWDEAAEAFMTDVLEVYAEAADDDQGGEGDPYVDDESAGRKGDAELVTSGSTQPLGEEEEEELLWERSLGSAGQRSGAPHEGDGGGAPVRPGGGAVGGPRHEDRGMVESAVRAEAWTSRGGTGAGADAAWVEQRAAGGAGQWRAEARGSSEGAATFGRPADSGSWASGVRDSGVAQPAHAPSTRAESSEGLGMPRGGPVGHSAAPGSRDGTGMHGGGGTVGGWPVISANPAGPSSPLVSKMTGLGGGSRAAPTRPQAVAAAAAVFAPQQVATETATLPRPAAVGLQAPPTGRVDPPAAATEAKLLPKTYGTHSVPAALSAAATLPAGASVASTPQAAASTKARQAAPKASTDASAQPRATAHGAHVSGGATASTVGSPTTPTRAPAPAPQVGQAQPSWPARPGHAPPSQPVVSSSSAPSADKGSASQRRPLPATPAPSAGSRPAQAAPAAQPRDPQPRATGRPAPGSRAAALERLLSAAKDKPLRRDGGGVADFVGGVWEGTMGGKPRVNGPLS